MNRIIAAMAALVLSTGCYAQDMIVKKDGSIIQAKVSEIGTSEVKYKKWSNQDGPSYAIAKSDILAITYQNGEKETFDDTESPASQTLSFSQGPILTERLVADNNGDLISKYDKRLQFKKTPKKIGKPCGAIGVFAFSDNSVLSNEDLEIEVTRSKSSSPATGALGMPIFFKKGECLVYRFCIKVKNKSDKMLYFDLANCTRTNYKTGESYSFFAEESVSVSKGNSSGAGIGIGVLSNVGVGLSGGSQSSVSKSYAQNRVVSVPPHGMTIIRDFTLEQIKNDRVAIVRRGEEMVFGYRSSPDLRWGGVQYQEHDLPWGIVRENEILDYTYEDSPLVLDYTFTYSSVPDFSTYSVVKSNLYLKELIGYYSQGLYDYWYNIKWNVTPIVSNFDGYDENTILGPIGISKP